jgi:hypothetical protein
MIFSIATIVRYLIIGGSISIWAGCSKVPLIRMYPQVQFAQGAWFKSESTLFLFYEVSGQDGFNARSRVEYRYWSDEGDSGWIPTLQNTNVHKHEAVDCGTYALCGSISQKVSKTPSQVKLRLRYHPEGETDFVFEPSVSLIQSDLPYAGLSYLVYGVFNSLNTRVQWRGRHNFPNIRNLEAEKYGLRRYFKVEKETYGNLASDLVRGENHYGFGLLPSCSGTFSPWGVDGVESHGPRGVMSLATWVPTGAADGASCAIATTTSAVGNHVHSALAQKNPEVAPAYGTLRTPIKETDQVKVVLSPCQSSPSKKHFKMQVQRILAQETIDICLDDERLEARLDAFFQQKLQERTPEKDKVFSVVFHREDSDQNSVDALVNSLKRNFQPEQSKSTPRSVGVFVYDSGALVRVPNELTSMVLWCPAKAFDDKEIPNNSQRACPVLPVSSASLGSLSFGNLDILPGRKEYEDFIKKYGETNSGKMTKFQTLAPQNTAQTKVIPFRFQDELPLGVASFFDQEVVSVEENQYFSYCPSSTFQISLLYKNALTNQIPVPLEALSTAHLLSPQPLYDLGIYWDYPFLLSIKFDSPLALDIGGSSAIVPFGIPNSNRRNYGVNWLQEGFEVGDKLKLCKRFCTHPPFDSAGVYNVQTQWHNSYVRSCYQPKFPEGFPGEKSNPYDP